MPDRDGYIEGVPCWIDTSQPDPEAAAHFYSGLFGWNCENVMPEGSPMPYFIGRVRGRDAAAIGAAGEGGQASWNTYIAVDSADDAAARVRDAGGQVVTEPFDVMDAGRMAVFTDPEGAEFRVWQPGENKGAGVVNEHGAVNFNGLTSNDPDTAKRFYGAVFGWGTMAMGGGTEAWTLPGYGDFLAQSDPQIRERNAQLGAPPGFEDVVATLQPSTDGQAAHWSVTFGVDDADTVAARATELGGDVRIAPFDAPWVRAAVIADPGGATFIVSQFVPENKDL